ncbi:MAG TPA: SGNH/GDSL hydrolase family protein, partial [Armatimonadota bacterium]
MATESATGVQVAKYDQRMRTDAADDTNYYWLSPVDPPFQLTGLPWFARDGRYRRLPVQPRFPLPEAVDALANCPAGAQLRFQTNSTRLGLTVRLAGPSNMYHMPATGQSGFDCYLRYPAGWRYVRTAAFAPDATTYQVAMYANLPREMRAVTLNFPLYQGVEDVQVGLEGDAELLPPPPFVDSRPIIIYGTSITQGGCACRPGMAHTNIISRRLNREVINLGFSGSGKGEPEVAEAIAEIPDPACYVLEYEANVLSADALQQTLPAFIDILRRDHPRVPILVVSRVAFANDQYDPTYLQARIARRDIQRTTVERLRQTGDAHLHFLDGAPLLGEDFDECTVDGVHPTDLGFLRIA